MQQDVHYTALLIVGRYADWLNTEPGLLTPLFSYVIAGLRNPGTSSSAAISFRNTCASCKQLIATSYLEDVLRVYQEVQALPLKLEDHCEILDGFACIISILPKEKCLPSLQQLCQPLVATLQTYANQPTGKDSHLILGGTLEKMAALFHNREILAGIGQNNNNNNNNNNNTNNSSDNSNLGVAIALWPLLEPLFTHQLGHSYVIEQLCRCTRYLVECCENEFTPTSILPSLSQKLKHGYKQARHSSLLRVATLLLKIYGKRPEYGAGLWNLTEDLARTTFGHVSQVDMLIANPDVIQDFAEMMEEILVQNTPFGKENQKRMVESGLTDMLVQWCIPCLTLHHHGTFKVVGELLVTMTSCEAVHPILGKHAVKLVHQLISCVTTNENNSHSHSRLNRVASVLRGLRKPEADGSHAAFYRVWLTSALKDLPIPDQDKAAFVECALTADVLTFENALADLVNLFRRYRRDTY